MVNEIANTISDDDWFGVRHATSYHNQSKIRDVTSLPDKRYASLETMESSLIVPQLTSHDKF